jgi:hypothetical protein
LQPYIIPDGLTILIYTATAVCLKLLEEKNSEPVMVAAQTMMRQELIGLLWLLFKGFPQSCRATQIFT